MNNRKQLITLIHVAKNQLALDDDTYRLMLNASCGKSSCSAMSIKELEVVLQMMEDRGFQRTQKQGGKKRWSPKTGKAKHEQINKIRAVWIQMSRDGFIHDGSETALDAYVRRMTKRNANDEHGVDHVGWLAEFQAVRVLESLKRWHRRVMLDALEQHGIKPPRNNKGYIAGYDEICASYQLKVAGGEHGKAQPTNQ